jgi:hypothetical protein
MAGIWVPSGGYGQVRDHSPGVKFCDAHHRHQLTCFAGSLPGSAATAAALSIARLDCPTSPASSGCASHAATISGRGAKEQRASNPSLRASAISGLWLASAYSCRPQTRRGRAGVHRRVSKGVCWFRYATRHNRPDAPSSCCCTWA